MRDAVQAVVAERDAVAAQRDRQVAAALVADPAAHLEDVRRVGRELQLQLHVVRLLGVVHDADALLEHACR